LYRSEAVSLHVAQQLLDTHTTVSATGLCPSCGIAGPCPVWEAADKPDNCCGARLTVT
jgi:hypothetical protein